MVLLLFLFASGRIGFYVSLRSEIESLMMI